MDGTLSATSDAGIRWPSSAGCRPTRTKGVATGAGTCQVIDIWVAGSAPKARWRPNGATDLPLTRGEPGNRLSDDGLPLGVSATAVPLSRVGPASRAPAPTSPPRRTVRRLRVLRNQSCCSARLSREAVERSRSSRGEVMRRP